MGLGSRQSDMTGPRDGEWPTARSGMDWYLYRLYKCCTRHKPPENGKKPDITGVCTHCTDCTVFLNIAPNFIYRGNAAKIPVRTVRTALRCLPLGAGRQAQCTGDRLCALLTTACCLLPVLLKKGGSKSCVFVKSLPYPSFFAS